MIQKNRQNIIGKIIGESANDYLTQTSEKKILTYFIMRVNIGTERVLPIDG